MLEVDFLPRKLFVMANLIDLWSVRTFDSELLAALRADKALIRNYFVTRTRSTTEHEAGDHRELEPSNPHFHEFEALEQRIGLMMVARVIRSWHFSRLTNKEVAVFRSEGIFLLTEHTLRRRLNARVDDSLLSAEQAKKLYDESVLHVQSNSRANIFSLTSHPHAINDSDVRDLLASWGGEVVYHWLQDPLLTELA
jgi:hypothetical protein